VERERFDLDWEAIGRRVLPASELQALRQLPPALRAAGYLRAWCRLEAKLKARGDGLSGLAALAAWEETAQQEAAQEACEGGAHGSGGPGRAASHSMPLWDLALPQGYGGAVALWQGAAAVES
jgi:hypothetical protein